MSDSSAPEIRLTEHPAFTEKRYREARPRYLWLGLAVFVFSVIINLRLVGLPRTLAVSNAAVSAVTLTVFALVWSRHRIWYYFTDRAIHRGWRPFGKLPPNGFIATRRDVKAFGPARWDGHPCFKVNIRGKDVLLCYTDEFRGSGEEKAASEWLKSAAREARRKGA